MGGRQRFKVRMWAKIRIIHDVNLERDRMKPVGIYRHVVARNMNRGKDQKDLMSLLSRIWGPSEGFGKSNMSKIEAKCIVWDIFFF